MGRLLGRRFVLSSEPSEELLYETQWVVCRDLAFMVPLYPQHDLL
jgi:hypothetical protein